VAQDCVLGYFQVAPSGLDLGSIPAFKAGRRKMECAVGLEQVNRWGDGIFGVGASRSHAWKIDTAMRRFAPVLRISV
jgi:hypothetical protein